MKIDKNIPAPKKRFNWKLLAQKMKIGDSILLENNSQRFAFSHAIRKNNPKETATSKETSGGIRVWKILVDEKLK